VLLHAANFQNVQDRRRAWRLTRSIFLLFVMKMATMGFENKNLLRLTSHKGEKDHVGECKENEEAITIVLSSRNR